MRKRYQTARDVKHERAIVKKLSRLFNMKAVEMDDHCVVDYVMKDPADENRVALECKQRTALSTTYETYSISHRKHNDMLAFCERHDIETLIVAVQWKDCLVWYDVTDMIAKRIRFQIQTGGRTDRDDLDDIEAMIHYPKAYANVIGEQEQSEAAPPPREFLEPPGDDNAYLPPDEAVEKLRELRKLLNTGWED